MSTRSLRSSFMSIFSQPFFDIYQQPTTLSNKNIYTIDLKIPGFSLFMGKIFSTKDDERLNLERDIMTNKLLFWVEPEDQTNQKQRRKVDAKISLENVIDEVEILVQMTDDPFYGLLDPLSIPQTLDTHMTHMTHPSIYDHEEGAIPPEQSLLFPFPLDALDTLNSLDPLFHLSPFFVDKREEKTKKDMLHKFYDILLDMAADRYHEFIASRRIQRVWREVIANPSFQVCRKRLRLEFEEMDDELSRHKRNKRNK